MKCAFVLSFLCLCLSLSAQPMLDGARVLSDLFDYRAKDVHGELFLERGIEIDEEHAAVLREYLPLGLKDSKDTAALRSGLEATFQGNPFFSLKLSNQTLKAFLEESREHYSAQSVPAGGFFVSNFADGLARFLVKRTKQELSVVFFEDFKAQVKDNPYLGHFCPFTREQLSLIDSKVYQFNDYLQTLREGFVADMMALPGSTERFLGNEALCSGCSERGEGKVMIDLLHVAQQMVNGASPVDMLSYLSHSGSAIQSARPADTLLYNMAAGLRLLNLLSESFRNTASSDPRMPWHSGREIRESLQDPKLLRIYLGLLWQRAGRIDFILPDGKQVSMRMMMEKANSGGQLLESWRKTIEAMSELMHSLQGTLHASAKTANALADDFFSYSQSVSDLLLSINQTGRTLLGMEGRDFIPNAYILLMRQSNAMYFNVRQGNFGGAMGNVVFCLGLLKKGSEGEQEKIAEILRYANFMAAIAGANSPEEMEHAVEGFALPPGSSQAKKYHGRFSVALNAYMGIALGREYLGSAMEAKDVGALAAPVGLSCTLGLGKGGGVGLFVPMIDVGAVTAYRFDDELAGDLPELSWNNILSPGLYIVYNAPGKWPFAFGYGAQLGPGLRKVTETKDGVALELEKNGWRHGIFLAVDIPITYFYLGRGK